eukprot:1657228-Rhodomonas_salina.1
MCIRDRGRRARGRGARRAQQRKAPQVSPARPRNQRQKSTYPVQTVRRVRVRVIPPVRFASTDSVPCKAACGAEPAHAKSKTIHAVP